MNFHLLSYFTSISFFITMVIVGVQSFWSEFEYIGVDNSKTGVIQTNMKVGRFNRTTVSLSGRMDITDMLKDYDCEWKAYYSSKGNSQYVLLPYKIPRDDCCKVFETLYWKAAENQLYESSNVPKRVAKEKYCTTLVPNNYTLTNFNFDPKVIPRFMEPGTYRCEVRLYRKGSTDASSLGIFFCKLY